MVQLEEGFAGRLGHNITQICLEILTGKGAQPEHREACLSTQNITQTRRPLNNIQAQLHNIVSKKKTTFLTAL